MKRSDLEILFLVMLVAAIIAIAVARASAQEATELYVPIGQSPGLSKEGKTIMGTVLRVDKDGRFSIVKDEQFFVVRTDDKTKFYIDRSHLKQSNSYGKFEGVLSGAFVEAYSPDGVAKWVKIRGQ